MTGPEIIACLIIAVFFGVLAAMDADRDDRAEHALKTGALVFIITLLITALCG